MTTPETTLIAEELDAKWLNVQVDSQILSTFMSCPAKCNYVFNRHLVPVRGIPSAFEKGQLAHIGLHAYWRERIKTGDYQASALAGLDAAKKASLTFNNLPVEDALDCFSTLVEFFKFIQSLSWIPIAVEQPFRFIAYEDARLRLRIWLTGRIDLILRTPQVPIIPVDNKSESERWFYSQLSNQFRIYALACKANVLGVQRFGFQKTVKPEDKFKMEMLPFDPNTLEEWRTTTLPYWIKQYLLCKEDNYWPMNHTSCISGHFACQFSDKYDGGICNVSTEVREQKLERYFKIGEEWNPMEF